MVTKGRTRVANTLNIFILYIFIFHQLRNKFLTLILISLDSASWELHQYSRRIRLVSVPNIEYFHKSKHLENKTAKKKTILMPCSVCLIHNRDILDQGQVTKYFCGISLVMYLVFYNYSNAEPECQGSAECVGQCKSQS